VVGKASDQKWFLSLAGDTWLLKQELPLEFLSWVEAYAPGCCVSGTCSLLCFGAVLCCSIGLPVQKVGR